MALPRITLGGVDVFKEWRASLAFLMGISGSGRIKVDATPNGNRASLSHDGKRFARLSGATNPYTATEVYPSASGGWDDAADSPTFTPVYDDWDQDGLDDKVVEIRPDAGEWRFLYKRIESTEETPPCDTIVKITVAGCHGVGLPGRSVTIHDGATLLASGSTDSSGYVEFTIYTATTIASATITVAAGDGFLEYVGTGFVLNCATRTLTLYMNVDADHICVPCCSTDGFPIPKDLELTTSAGSVSFTYSHSVGNDTYWEIAEIDVEVPTIIGATIDCCPEYDPFTAPCAFEYYGPQHASTFTAGTETRTFKFQLACISKYVSGSITWNWILMSGVFYSVSPSDCDCYECDGDGLYEISPSSGTPDVLGGTAPYDGGCGGGVPIEYFSPIGRIHCMTGTCSGGVLALTGTMPDGRDIEVPATSIWDGNCCYGEVTMRAAFDLFVPNPFAGSLAVDSL